MIPIITFFIQMAALSINLVALSKILSEYKYLQDEIPYQIDQFGIAIGYHMRSHLIVFLVSSLTIFFIFAVISIIILFSRKNKQTSKLKSNILLLDFGINTLIISIISLYCVNKILNAAPYGGFFIVFMFILLLVFLGFTIFFNLSIQSVTEKQENKNKLNNILKQMDNIKRD